MFTKIPVVLLALSYHLTKLQVLTLLQASWFNRNPKYLNISEIQESYIHVTVAENYPECADSNQKAPSKQEAKQTKLFP